MANVTEWVNGGAPGISAERLNEPFHIAAAVYDSVNNKIDVTIGPGRADFGGGTVVEFTSNQTLYITGPATNTTYYIFLNSNGTFTYSTTATPGTGQVRLGSVATGATLDALTRTDRRGLLPGAAAKTVADDLVAKMNASTGHKHTGAAGDAPKLPLSSLDTDVATQAELDAHISRTDNPHATTAAQVGALVSIDGVSNPGGNIDLIAVGNIEITPDDANNRITIAGTGAKLVTMQVTAAGWTAKASMPTARDRLAAAAPGNGKLYAVGGYNGANLATCEEYDPATNTWTARAAMPTARYGLAAATPGNGKLYAVGGWNGSYLATCEEYNPKSVTSPVTGVVTWPNGSTRGVLSGQQYLPEATGTAVFVGA